MSRSDAHMGRGGWPKGRGRDADGNRGRSVVEVVGQGLIEYELRDRFPACLIEVGGLVEQEVTLWRTSGWGNGWG